MKEPGRLHQVSNANRNETVKIFGKPFKMIACAILSKPKLIRQSSPRTVKHVTEIIPHISYIRAGLFESRLMLTQD